MTDVQDISGKVWAVFGHRLAIEGNTGRVLADLGPKGAEKIAIAVGDTVSLTGERKPTEIKVTSIALGDGTTHAITWPKKPEHGKTEDDQPDPAAAVASVKAQGYAVEGEPKRKPKHFEIVGSKGGSRNELHVTFDGTIRKIKPVTA